jgi:hypothetical protein
MYLMYVDESGDCGLVNSPTRYFILSGLIVHETRWRDCLDRLTRFRLYLRQRYSIHLREELHAAELVSRPGLLARLKRSDRLAVIRAFANQLAAMRDFSMISIVVDKAGKPRDYDVFANAWTAIVRRFEAALTDRGLSGSPNAEDQGFILCDSTDAGKLMFLLRSLHQYQPLPDAKGGGVVADRARRQYVIEDACHLDSEHSYFVQAVDLVAFLLYQKLAPSRYMKKRQAYNYFGHLQSIAYQTAARGESDGVIYV